ncbi:hypothetical protein BKH42_00655 [Helicobacter sp. 13S00482-2]|uniref:glycosyltransferase family 4 protein n=1 Tax=Helicobacter sp. 13S00482-2 TaxID=1476200 RepID=UPI000BA62FFD|nr:glycosyltransferase family 1 protein [Helicobacter sp. 13S00482-2]PAF54456.1 hypothetical protein BKH42_00655 [Helicobacter sp. 13S00482-2]
MKVIFDATVLGNIAKKNISRSGIFFSAYNLFLEMLQNENFEVLLYCDIKSLYALKKYSQSDDKLRDIQNIFLYSKPNQWVSYGFYLRSLFFPKNIVQMFFAKSFTLMLLILKKIFSVFDTLALDKDEYYVFFSPMEKIPQIFKDNDRIIKFTLLHDLIPIVCEGYFVSKKSWFYQLFNSLNSEDYYFANSVYTKEDFIKHCPQIDPHKISVAHLGVNENFYPDKNERKNHLIREKYHIPKDKKYIFSLCSIEPRKNVIFIVENFIEFIKQNEIQDVVFVLAGGHWEEFIQKLEDKIHNLGVYKNKIIRAGYVDDGDLSNLYSHSLCSVYLSVYEGFGLPALEAMSCGAPLIASNVTSIPEVVGDGGILISPSDSLALKEAFKKIYLDSSFAQELSLKGINQAKKFSWKKCVQEMAERMKAVLESKCL